MGGAAADITGPPDELQARIAGGGEFANYRSGRGEIEGIGADVGRPRTSALAVCSDYD